MTTVQTDTAVLAIDVEAEVARISASLRDYLTRARRKGAVVALSGGIDSSVVAALCVGLLVARGAALAPT